jgi:DNA-binding transcriptional regulator YdaS (Cro superfamily)
MTEHTLKSQLSPEQVRQRLIDACAKAGSQRAWAKAHGISPQAVSDVCSGQREPSEGIGNALKLVCKRVFYEI